MIKLFIIDNLFLDGAMEDMLHYCDLKFDDIASILKDAIKDGPNAVFRKIKNIEKIKETMGDGNWGEIELSFILEIESFRRKLIEINFQPYFVKVSNSNYILLIGEELICK